MVVWEEEFLQALLLEEVLEVVERAICLFRDEGITGERFADTVARLGFDYVNEKLTGK